MKADPVKIVSMYRNGQTLREIGGQLGISMQRVHQRLKEAGEPLRSRGYRKTRGKS
tara:strand:+ start:162 stop:329 length:168 start_codon:yes stop_codon:yes gene_type:complete